LWRVAEHRSAGGIFAPVRLLPGVLNDPAEKCNNLGMNHYRFIYLLGCVPTPSMA
jgi:hypothetical protein